MHAPVPAEVEPKVWKRNH